MFILFIVGTSIAIVSSVIIANIICYVQAPGFKVAGKHVFITGGSTGLGFATARKYAASGAKVSIIARKMPGLKAAKQKLEQEFDSLVFIGECDVTDYKKITKIVHEAIKFHNLPIYHVICCAGLALPGYFIDQDISIFKTEMDVNYFGALNTVKAVVPTMIENEQEGQVVFVSSGCGYIGFIGYSQYCPSKYALRGLSDCLRNELKLYNIKVSTFYPGNMDTLGYENEQKEKPVETQMIEGSSELVSADNAASSMIQGISNGEYAITNDIGIWLLRIIGNGIAPRQNMPLETLLLPLAALIQTIYGMYMDYVVISSKKSIKSKIS